MMSDIPPMLQDRLKPLFFKKDDYAEKLCRNGKEIRRVQLELMSGTSKETLLRSQRLIEETAYLTAKLRALEREIDGVLTQEMLFTACCPEGGASAEAGGRRSRQPQPRRSEPIGSPLAEQVDRLATKSLICDQVEGNMRVEEKAEG